METDRSFADQRGSSQQQLDIAERASAAPYVDYPPTPRWYAPSIGVWAACMVAATAHIGSRKVVAVPVLIALIALEGAFLAWYRNYMGTMPKVSGAPREIRLEMNRYFIGAAAAFIAVIISTVAIGWVCGAIVAFVTVTVGLTIYERRYAAAAERTKQRLS